MNALTIELEARITEEKIDALADAMRENITTGDTPFRRACIRSVVDRVVDSAEIRIKGRRNVFERRVMGGGAGPAGVPGFVRNWRTRHDSNV